MKKRGWLCGALCGLSLTAILVVLPRTTPPPASTRAPAARAAASPTNFFERTLREAQALRLRALMAEIREREELEDWDPVAAAGPMEGIRRAHLAQDRSGDLRRARAAARQATASARTTREAYAAACLLQLIERDLGNRLAELNQVRKLAALAPRDWWLQEALRSATTGGGPVAIRR
jgi:hypothetical protein